MPFVISSGQLQNIDRPHMRVLTPALELTPNVHMDYATIWRTQPQIRTVVGFLGRNIAQIALHVYRRVSDVDRERLSDHQLAVLLKQPAPHTTRYRLIDALVQDLAVYDNAYWLKVRDFEQPKALVRLDPLRTCPIGDNAFMASAFEYRGGRGIQTFDAEQVVHFRGYNPQDPREGASPIEALRTILAEDYQAANYREQMWRNGARASGYLQRPVEAPEWSREARDRFRLQWQAQYSGEGANAGGTPILEDGMAFVSASVTPEQAQYLEARKLTREEVAAAYHIPPPMVGILDHATYSNITEQHKIMYQDCLGPWLQMISQEIELQLLSDFGDRDDVYVEFNIGEKLRGSFEEQAEQLQVATGAPYMLRNEARALLNLPQVDGGDELITPLNVLIGGQASARDSAPPPDGAIDNPPAPAPDDGEPKATRYVKARAHELYTARAQSVLSGYFARQGQTVTSRLGAAKRRKAISLGTVYDRSRWVSELAAELFGLAAIIATAAAKATLRALRLDPDSYQEDRTLEYLRVHAERVAEQIEDSTEEDLRAALGEEDPLKAVATLFATYATDRAQKIATSEVTELSGFGSSEAVEKSGRPATKTWRVRNSNPRPSHAALDGETVPLDGRFSNGGRWPGDRQLPPTERYGCDCEMTVALAD